MVAAPYATEEDLEAYLKDGTMPAAGDVDRLLLRASEAVAEATRFRSELVVANPSDFSSVYDDIVEALRDATCAQVEFWIEVGEEHDSESLPTTTAVNAGRLQLSRRPGLVGDRALRYLRAVGMVASGVSTK